MARFAFAAALLISCMPLAMAQTETVLYSFPGGPTTGGSPIGPLIFDSSGNLYGSVSYPHDGMIFEMTPGLTGWTETVLHRFKGSPDDGEAPYSGLAMDAKGRLYGTTYYGGAHNQGTVFQLTQMETGVWKEQVLYSFGASATDGLNPWSGPPILDSKGNLYDTTFSGGAYGFGSVFELSRNVSGGWDETVLYSFQNSSDGNGPTAGLILDSKHNLYGADGLVVFELARGAGKWTFSVLHTFSGGNDGLEPDFQTLIFDKQGNLYGTTEKGGAYGFGTVFELTQSGSGTWTESILYSFPIGPSYGAGPSGVMFDQVGSLYGTTAYGAGTSGCNQDLGCGTVYELTPAAGVWNYSLVYAFTGGSDGGNAARGVLFDSSDNLYGATSNGGNASGCPYYYYGCGVVYEITP